MSEFSEKTQALLAKAGWQPGRSRPLSKYVSTLEANGYTMYESVRLFLAEYGGLFLTMGSQKDAWADCLQVDPLRAIDIVEREKVAVYERRLGAGLCVVGTGHRDHLVLMMDEKGAIYGGYDDYFDCLGKDSASAIEALCRDCSAYPT